MYLRGDFGAKATDVDPYVASTFYAADRYASFKTEWEQFYNEGGIILADRYTTSNMVHQASKMAKEDRKELLKKMAEKFDTFIYTPEKSDIMMAKNRGKVDYYTQAPYVYHNSKINLNFSLRCIKSGIPLRCIDILGAGGFLITNYQKDMEKHFKNKKDLVWYHSPEELMQLIGYYLTHNEERETIAANGQRKVLSLFSYEQMLSTIFETVKCNPVVEHTHAEIPISICLIGKNEEKHVDSCLKPWYDLGFEIVVADTGSTDKTMELVRKYTNNVFYHPWTNHFAEATVCATFARAEGSTISVNT